MANMFSTAKAGKFTDTYARVPFQEIANMGDKLQKKTEKAQEVSSALSEMIATDAFGDEDTQARNEILQEYESTLEGISGNHFKDADQAMRDSRAFAAKLNKDKTRGRLGSIQKNFDARQGNIKTLDSALAANLISTEKYNYLLNEGAKGYKGAGQGENGVYGSYTDVMPAILKNGFREQVDVMGKNWAEERGYKLKHTEDGSYYVNEDGREISEEEVRAGVNDMLRLDGKNESWARQEAKVEMSRMDPNKQQFTLPDGSMTDRQGFEDALVKDKYSRASDYGATKYGYKSKTASLSKAYLNELRYKAGLTAKKANTYGISGKGFGQVTSESIDNTQAGIKESKTQIKDFNRMEKEYTEGMSAKQLSELANDKDYQQLLQDRNKVNIQLAEQEGLIAPSKTLVNKKLDDRDKDYSFYQKGDKFTRGKKGFMSTANTHTGYGQSALTKFVQKYEEEASKSANGYISGLVPSDEFANAMSAIKNSNDPTKLETLFKNGIKEDVTYNELLESFGFGRGDKSMGVENKLLSMFDHVKARYESVGNKYQKDLVESLKETPAQIRHFKIVAGINNTKFASEAAVMDKTLTESAVNSNFQGISLVGGDQINKHLIEEIPDYENNSGSYGKSLQMTTGWNNGPISNLVVTAPGDDKKQRNFAVTGTPISTYMRAGRDLQLSDDPTDRSEGTKMVQNATPYAGSHIGSVVNATNLENMFDGNEPHMEAVSPIVGFKSPDKKQYYIRPKKTKGNIKPLWEIVTKKDDGYTSSGITIGGTDDLRSYLYNSKMGKQTPQ